MTTLSVLKDNNSHIHLKQNHLGGWFIAIFGAAICFFPQIKPIDEGVWILYTVGGLFIIVGILAAFYRLEVRLDLLQRKYKITKGFWPSPKCRRGSFEHFEGLWFTKQWRTSGGKNSSKYLVWQTCLKLKLDKNPICIHESSNESNARAYFEQRAKQLKIKTFDHTGNTVKEKNWDELDEPVSDQLSDIQYQTVDLNHPPQGLIFKKQTNAISYMLPAPGFNGTSLLGCLFGLPFFIMGIFSIMISLDLHELFNWDLEVSGSMVAAFILGFVFTLIGGFIIKASIDYAFTHYQFTYNAREFTYATFVYGHLTEEKRFPYAQIEEFDLRDSTETQRPTRYRAAGMEIRKYHQSDKLELFIRTHTEVIKLRTLQAEISQFLRNVFYQNLKKNYLRS